nr:MAG TPA: hypothetical protein [Caudoviricetes sp.]
MKKDFEALAICQRFFLFRFRFLRLVFSRSVF